MSVTHPTRAARALFVAVVALPFAAAPVAAHAELETMDPADKSEVEAPFAGPIVLTFSEELAAGSKADLKSASGATIASGTIDGDKLRIALSSPLEPGTYTVRWVSVAGDGDVLRGTPTFTVVASPPTPTPPPTATPGLTAPPTPPPAATPSPTPSGNGTPAGSSADVLFPLLAAVIAVAALGAFLLRNRRPARR